MNKFNRAQRIRVLFLVVQYGLTSSFAFLSIYLLKFDKDLPNLVLKQMIGSSAWVVLPQVVSQISEDKLELVQNFTVL